MRITFRGHFTPVDVAHEIAALFKELSEMGVDQLDMINVYFNPRANGAPVELRDHDGSTIDVLTVRGRTVRGYAKDDPEAPPSAAPSGTHLQ